MAQTYENIVFQKTLPRNLIWTGLLIIFCTLSILFLVGWLLKYSDKVVGKVLLTTPTIPLEIPTKTAGVLNFFVENEQQVEEGTVIALIKNNIIPYPKVLQLEEYLGKDLPYLEQAEKISNQEITQLGDLKNSFVSVRERLNSYKNFTQSNQQVALVASKENRIRLYKKRLLLLEEKGTLAQKDIDIATRQVEGKTRLNRDTILSNLDLERALQEEIDKKVVNLDNKEAINTINILIAELEQEIIELQSLNQETLEGYQDAVQLSLSNLRNDIHEWKNKYLIVANRSGTCVWSEYLSDGQYIPVGQMVCTIISEEQKQPIAKMEIAMKGSSKVEVGQEVNILLDNYPPSEFGILKGEVAKISSLPENSLWRIDVTLPSDLISTYGLPLTFQQLAEGRGEIITNKMSFLGRIWQEAKGRRLNE